MALTFHYRPASSPHCCVAPTLRRRRKGKKKGGRKKQALTKGDHGKPMSFVADKATKGSGGGGGNGSAALRKKSGGRSGRTDVSIGPT